MLSGKLPISGHSIQSPSTLHESSLSLQLRCEIVADTSIRMHAETFGISRSLMFVTGRQRETTAKKSRLSTITTKTLPEPLLPAQRETSPPLGQADKGQTKSPKWQKRKKVQKLRKAAQRELILTSTTEPPKLFRELPAENRALQVCPSMRT